MRAKRLRRALFCTLALIAAIIVAYKALPSSEIVKTNHREVFEQYSSQAILKLDTLGRINVDSLCRLDHPMPEIAYVLPLILNTYVEIVEKPTMPILTRLDDTLQIKLRGYKQFKNRGIRLTKLLQRKLGNRYGINITSKESEHTLQITYSGTPWDKEQLMALPVMEAAQRNNIDPALLMSLIRHVSNFDFDYHGPKDAHGLLSMNAHIDHSSNSSTDENSDNEPEGLEQVFAGAKRLSKQLQILSQEKAIASFYPEQSLEIHDANWSKSPLVKSWVNQVLTDVEFYRNNGL